MSRSIASSEYYRATPLRVELSWGAIISGLDTAMLVELQIRQDLYNLWIHAGIMVFSGAEGVEPQLALNRKHSGAPDGAHDDERRFMDSAGSSPALERPEKPPNIFRFERGSTETDVRRTDMRVAARCGFKI